MAEEHIPASSIAKLLANFDYFDTAVITISGPTEVNSLIAIPGGRPRLLLKFRNTGSVDLLIRPSNDHWDQAWVVAPGGDESTSLSAANELWFNVSAGSTTVQLLWGW